MVLPKLTRAYDEVVAELTRHLFAMEAAVLPVAAHALHGQDGALQSQMDRLRDLEAVQLELDHVRDAEAADALWDQLVKLLEQHRARRGSHPRRVGCRDGREGKSPGRRSPEPGVAQLTDAAAPARGTATQLYTRPLPDLRAVGPHSRRSRLPSRPAAPYPATAASRLEVGRLRPRATAGHVAEVCTRWSVSTPRSMRTQSGTKVITSRPTGCTPPCSPLPGGMSRGQRLVWSRNPRPVLRPR